MAAKFIKRMVTLQNKPCISLKINMRLLSNSSKSYSKKKINIKNTFTFKNEFQEKFAESRLERRIVSADLLQNQDQISRRINKNTAKRIPKPSLTYRGEILFGIHPVYLALLQKKRIFYKLYIRKEDNSSNEEGSSRKEEIIRLAESMGIIISLVDSRGLKILAPGVVHQGVCLDAGFLPLPTWNEDPPEYNDPKRIPLWLVLDEILDPMNVGAIIRSAYYFGVNKVFTVKGNSCKLSPTVSKASSGALEVMNMYQIDNLEDFIKDKKKNEWCIVSTSAYADNQIDCCKSPINATDFTMSKPTILILGNEGRGISKNIINLCDSLISIAPGQELHQGIDSLNVSVATGVLLYTLKNMKNRR